MTQPGFPISFKGVQAAGVTLYEVLYEGERIGTVWRRHGDRKWWDASVDGGPSNLGGPGFATRADAGEWVRRRA